MKKLLDIKRFKVYLWFALAFLILGFISNAVYYHPTLLQRTIDDAWRTIYVTVINYILFEYTWPRLSRKRFFTSVWLIIVHIFLYSAGLTFWRFIGIQLSIYTPFPVHDQKDVSAEQMGYSMGSIFFYAIARHIYLHIRLKRTARQLLIEKQQAELNYLKSQTNPHFLFNTLNNIYSLAI